MKDEDSCLSLVHEFPQCGVSVDIGMQHAFSVSDSREASTLNKQTCSIHVAVLCQATSKDLQMTTEKATRSCSGTKLKELPLGRGTRSEWFTSAKDKIIFKINLKHI